MKKAKKRLGKFWGGNEGYEKGAKEDFRHLGCKLAIVSGSDNKGSKNGRTGIGRILYTWGVCLLTLDRN